MISKPKEEAISNSLPFLQILRPNHRITLTYIKFSKSQVLYLIK
jgi:hypothetical protein